MKKVNWGVGLPFTIIISILVSLPILIHFSIDELNLFIRSTCYNFILTQASWYIFHKVLESKYLNTPRGKTLYFTLCSLIAIVFAFLLHFLLNIMIGPTIKPLLDSSGTRFLVLIAFRGLMLGGLIAFVINYLDVIREKQVNTLIIEQLKKKQLEANLSSLKEQMSPHFLFNSLNSLISLIRNDGIVAINFVIRLSEVYRYLLQHREHQTVSLHEELDFIQAYIYLLKVRFKNNIKVTIAIPNQFYHTRIPPLTLQLLLENSVKHNVASRTMPLEIGISIENNMILVSNNIQPRVSLETSHGFGLTSMEEQYRMLVQENIVIRSDNQIFKVLLPIII